MNSETTITITTSPWRIAVARALLRATHCLANGVCAFTTWLIVSGTKVDR